MPLMEESPNQWEKNPLIPQATKDMYVYVARYQCKEGRYNIGREVSQNSECPFQEHSGKECSFCPPGTAGVANVPSKGTN